MFPTYLFCSFCLSSSFLSEIDMMASASAVALGCEVTLRIEANIRNVE